MMAASILELMYNVHSADIAQMWLPPKGSGHVGYYHTLREALDAFRMGLRTGEIYY